MSRAWMPLYVADYLADTGHLSASEHGAYLLLIMHYWQNGGLPADDTRLMRLARMTPKEWKGSRDTIAGLFEDGWKHKRIDGELARAEELSNKRSAAAKQRGTKTQANAPAIAVQLDTQSQSQSPIASASSPEQTASQINRLNRILGFDERDFTKHAENIRILCDLEAKGCDFERHILPAAEAAARSKKARSLAYIMPKAVELRDAEKTVRSLPVPFENTDERGWRDRLRVWGEKGLWNPKWGPKPGEPGSCVPATILNAEKERAA